jgi:hypothetical protein
MISITKIAKTTLERLSRDWVLTRWLPKRFWGRCFDSTLSLIGNRWVKEANVVWNMDANAGVFAFASGHNARGGKVVAVRPDPFLAGLLRRSRQLQENRDLNVDAAA